jgi:predicted nucleic acid-binding protein
MVDTNVLVYAADADAGNKHALAVRFIDDLTHRQVMAVSVQVLNEFYSVSKRRNRRPALSSS